MGTFDNQSPVGASQHDWKTHLKPDGPWQREIARLMARHSSPEEIAQFLVDNPAVSNLAVDFLHQHAGNAFVQRVIAASRSPSDKAPPATSGPSHNAPTTEGNKGTVRPETYRPQAVDAGVAYDLLVAAYSIVTSGNRGDINRIKITSTTSHYVAELDKLYSAMKATNTKTGAALSASERLALLTEARDALKPLVGYEKTGNNEDSWIEGELMPRLDSLQANWAADDRNERYNTASDRVDNAVLLPNNKIIDVASDKDPRAQGAQLRPIIKDYVGTLQSVHEKIIVATNEEAMKEQATELVKGESASGTAERIAAAMNILNLADGYLTLTDEKVQEEGHELAGHLNCHAIATYAELVKAIVEFTGGTAGLTLGAIGGLLKLAGEAETAAQVSGFVTQGALGLGKVISFVEIIKSSMTLLDSKASRQQKLDAGVGLVGGLIGIGGKVIGEAASVGGSFAIAAGYAEAKWALNTYWESALGFNTGAYRAVFEHIQMLAEPIAGGLDRLQKAYLLSWQERDPSKLQPLNRVMENTRDSLSKDLDYFILRCHERDDSSETAVQSVAGYPILMELFAPLDEYRGTTSVDQAMQGATDLLKKVSWAFRNGNEIILESTKKNRRLADVYNDVDEKEQQQNSKSGEGAERADS